MRNTYKKNKNTKYIQIQIQIQNTYKYKIHTKYKTILNFYIQNIFKK